MERSQRRIRWLGCAAWFAFVVGIWHQVLSADMAALGAEVSAGALGGVVIATLAGRLAAQLLEAGFYVATWRLLARPVRFGPLYVAVVSLSLLDALAAVIARSSFAADHAPWAALLVGPRALPEAFDGSTGLGVAFGTCGLLTCARLAGTVAAQSRERVPWPQALALTLAVWLGGRLATWWCADLLRGMSPLG